MQLDLDAPDVVSVGLCIASVRIRSKFGSDNAEFGHVSSKQATKSTPRSLKKKQDDMNEQKGQTASMSGDEICKTVLVFAN